jgi:hypothetical protein
MVNKENVKQRLENMTFYICGCSLKEATEIFDELSIKYKEVYYGKRRGAKTGEREPKKHDLKSISKVHGKPKKKRI